MEKVESYADSPNHLELVNGPQDLEDIANAKQPFRVRYVHLRRWQ